MVRILFNPGRWSAEQIAPVRSSDNFFDDSIRSLDSRLMTASLDLTIQTEQCRRIIEGWHKYGRDQAGESYEYGIAVYGRITPALRSWLLSHQVVGGNIGIWIYEPLDEDQTPIEWVHTGIYTIHLADILQPDRFFDGKELPEPSSNIPPWQKQEFIQITMDDGRCFVTPRRHLSDSVEGELDGLEPGGDAIILEFKLVMMTETEADALPEYEG